MPADAIAGFFEAVTGLVQAIAELLSSAVEGTVTLFELLVEGVFLVIQFLFFIVGRARTIGRPDWIVRRRQSPASRIKSLVIAVLFLGAFAYGAFQSFGYTRLSFSQNGFSRPDGVEVTLVRGESTRVAMIEDGALKVRRGRWDSLLVRDPRYRPADFAISGRRMDLRLVKIQTTRDAATEAVIDKAADLLRKKFGQPRESKPTEEGIGN
jgi:hypothetical protein